MAWRNVQQAISASIPQNIISNPEGFITAFNNASTPQQKEQVYASYVFPTWNGADTRNIVAERLLGDNTNYCNITDSGSGYSMQCFYNGSQINFSQGDFKSQDYTACYVALVDDDTQTSFFSGFIRYRQNQACGQMGGTVPTTSGTLSQQLYTILTSNPYIQYAWQSVPAISGKNGILSLAMIKDEALGDGAPVTGGDVNDIVRLSPGSRVTTLAGNIGENEQQTIIYSGDVYRLDIKRTVTSIPLPVVGPTDISNAELRFYLQPTTGGVENLIYSYSVPFGASAAGSESLADSYISIIVDDENEVAALSVITPDGANVDYNTPGSTMSAEDMHLLWIWVRAGSTDNEDDDPLDSFEDNEGDGGGDLINRPNNPIPEPGVPGLSAYDSGFVSQYVLSKEALKNLSDFLWSADFVENVQKFFNDPRQIIQGIVISDVFPIDYNTTATEIKAGGISTGINGNKLNKQFERYEMGELTIDKRLKDSSEKGGIYFDYAPFTNLKLYLPYCGEHSLNPDDVIGKTLKLAYTVDHLSGICCAHLTIKGSADECHYNYTGQMGVQIPLSAEDYGGLYRAVLSAGAAIGGALATTAAGGMTAPLAIGSAANAISNIANMGRDVEYTSGGGSIAGELSSEYPYITIEEPDAFMATNQKHYTGYPCFSTYKLKEMQGYTKISAIHLDGLSCTEKEREAIRAQLSNGVIIQQGDELPHPAAPEGQYNFILLQNLSDVDTIGKKFSKTGGEVDYVVISGEILYNQDFAAVGLLVGEYNSGYNYVYIPAFGRTYYVDGVTAESGTMVRYDLVSDASESFWNELKECEALIETTQQKSKAKLLVNNNTWYMPQKKNVKTLTFKDNLGKAAHFSRVPVTQGGKQCFLITIAGG